MKKNKLFILVFSIIFISSCLLILIKPFKNKDNAQEKPIALINGNPVFFKEFQWAFDQLRISEEKRQGKEIKEESFQYDRLKKVAFEQLISRVLLVEQGEKNGIIILDEDLEIRLAELKNEFPSKEAFAQVLAARNMELEDLKRGIRHDMTSHKYLETIGSAKYQDSESAQLEFFQANPHLFHYGEGVRIQHILALIKPNIPREMAHSKIKAAWEKLESGGDFSLLAGLYSDDKSADSGGNVGPIRRGETIKEFEDRIFSMKEGEISDIFETPSGFHIVRLISKEPAGEISFEDARPKIRLLLKESAARKEIQEHIKTLRENAKIEISTDFKLVDEGQN